MLIEILGLVFCILLGTIGHFLYNWSSKNKIIGYFFATNESLWQHIKLGVTPIILWTIIEFFTFKFENLFFVKFISIFIFIISLLTLYYFYKFFSRKNLLFLDIIIFYISLAFSFIVSMKLISCNCFNIFFSIIGLVGLLFIVYFYRILNKY